VINNLTFCAYGWDFGKPLDWGAGGPSSWPQAKAYRSDGKSENQLGFRVYEWHAAAVESVFSRKFPFHLLQIGLPKRIKNSVSDILKPDFPKQDAVMRLLNRENVYDPQEPDKLLSHIPEDVLSGNFHLLTSNNPLDLSFQWFSAEGEALSPAQAYAVRRTMVGQPPQEHSANPTGKENEFQFNRYVLISEELQNEAQDILEKMRPYLDRYKPMVGYSLHEAAQSAIVVYLTSVWEPDEESINMIRARGNLVKQVHPDEIPNLLKEITHAQ
jgi:hypothetical protein